MKTKNEKHEHWSTFISGKIVRRPVETGFLRIYMIGMHTTKTQTTHSGQTSYENRMLQVKIDTGQLWEQRIHRTNDLHKLELRRKKARLLDALIIWAHYSPRKYFSINNTLGRSPIDIFHTCAQTFLDPGLNKQYYCISN